MPVVCLHFAAPVKFIFFLLCFQPGRRMFSTTQHCINSWVIFVLFLVLKKAPFAGSMYFKKKYERS